MRSSTKLPFKSLVISDFTGGLNNEQSPYIIKFNEASVLENFIVGLNGIERRKGFVFTSAKFGKTIQNGFAYQPGKWVFVDEDWNVILYDHQSQGFSVVGQITGTLTPKFAFFAPYICIATGGSLWLLDTSSNTLTLSTSPTANDVVVKDGRVWIGGGDELWASRVGDPTDWTNVATDASSAQFFQVGYKDGGSIVGLTLLYNDIIIFKTTGTYRFVGSANDAAISIVSHNRTALNNTSYVSFFGDVIVYDSQGAYRISTVMRYGDLKIDGIDIKVLTFLRQNYAGRIFYLPSLEAVAFKLNKGFLVYFYRFNAWGVWITANNINLLFDDGVDLIGVTSRVYSYSGLCDNVGFIADENGTIYEATNYIADYQGALDYFYATYKGKKINNGYDYFVKRIGFGYEAGSDGDAFLQVGDVVLNLNISVGVSPFIYDEQDVYIADASDNINTTQLAKGFVQKRQVKRSGEIEVIFKTNTDLKLNQIVVDYANFVR
jgi:hypothetical protein